MSSFSLRERILLPQIVICCNIQYLRFRFEVFFARKSNSQVSVDDFNVSVVRLREALERCP